MSRNNSPEVELVLACARVAEERAIADNVRALLQNELDWGYLGQIALRHRQIPSLYTRLSTLGRGAVPPDVQGHLRRQFYAIAQHNQYLMAELVRLLRLLGAEGIGAIPFKGPALAAAVYRNPQLRVSSDIDILVGRDDVPRAVELLCRQGYRLQFKHGAIFEAGARPFRHAYNLTSADGRHSVDLHWKLSQSYFAFALALSELRQHLVPVTLNGEQYATLGPEHMLIFLCMHGARHSWARLAWVCDIAELLHAYPQLHWNLLLRQATDLHCRRMLLLGLQLARNLLAAPLPTAVAHEIAADEAVIGLAGQVRAWLFDRAAAPTELEQARFYLAVRERWWDKVQYGPELVRILLAR